MTTRSALVVDDSKSARFAVRRLLEGCSYIVETAETAEEGLAWLKDHRPDVIFLDYTLPGADGFEVLRQLKKDGRTVTIPVVICSSHEGNDFVTQARSRGAVDVLRKPPNPQLLVEVLKSVERAAEAFKAVPQPARPVAPPAAEVPPAPATPKVHSIRPPEATIEQRVMQTLRESMSHQSAASPPAREKPADPALPTAPLTTDATAQARVASDSQLKKLAQDLYAQFGELKAHIAIIEGSRVSEEMVREVVREEIAGALADLREDLLKAARQAASEEAQTSAERTVMNAASRVSEQMAQSLLKTLGPLATGQGEQKQGS